MKLSIRENYRMPFHAALVSVSILLTVLSGCTTPERPMYSSSEAERAQIAGFENIRAHVDDPRPTALEHDPWIPVVVNGRPTMLAISGGGSGGAFAVGILSAWSELGTRPNFAVMTGVSTGALIAPLAFLGPEYDEQLRRLYLSDKTRGILDIEWKGVGVFSPCRLAFNRVLPQSLWLTEC